jgi:hypothetical protein
VAASAGGRATRNPPLTPSGFILDTLDRAVAAVYDAVEATQPGLPHRLTPEQLDALDQLAASYGIDRRQIVTEIIENALAYAADSADKQTNTVA